MALNEDALEAMMNRQRDAEEPPAETKIVHQTDEFEVYERATPRPEADARNLRGPPAAPPPPTEAPAATPPAAPAEPVPEATPSPAPTTPEPAPAPPAPAWPEPAPPPAQAAPEAPAPVETAEWSPETPAGPAPSDGEGGGRTGAPTLFFPRHEPTPDPAPSGSGGGPGGDPHEGRPRLAVVQADFNRDITDAMAEWGLRHAKNLGATVTHHVHVAGVFDTPLAAKVLAHRDDVDAIVVIGCVIQGETAHDAVISEACAHRLQALAYDTEVPIGFGVIGPGMTKAQAEARVGVGKQAVEAAVRQWRMICGLRDPAHQDAAHYTVQGH